MKRKLLLSSLAVVAAAALVGGGTLAMYTDTEESANHSVAAGTLDLELVNEPYAEYVPFTVANAAPGNSSVGNTRYVHFRNNGTIGGKLFVRVVKTSDEDNGIVDPEDDVDSTNGSSAGELDSNLLLSIDGIGAMIGQPLTALDGNWYEWGNLPGGAEGWVSIDWAIPGTAGNEIQSDSTAFKLEFKLDQV